MTKYTIEQFIEDFEDAQTPDAKNEVFQKIIDSDIDLVGNKELLMEYKSQIVDIKEQLNKEEDIKINYLIDRNLVELWTCIKSVNEFVEGSRYYVQISDLRKEYSESFEGDVPESIKDYINGIKPLIWIVNDSGIGSLKYKVLVNFDFSKHFNK